MLDKSKITGAQFLFTVACFLQSATLITSFFVKISLHDSIFVMLTGFILLLPVLFLFLFIMKTFPGKNLIQINDIVFGKFIGKIISVIYLFFFLSLSSLNLRDMGDFVNNTFMTKTPLSVLIILFMTICVWAVKNGLDVVTRYNIFLSVLILIAIIFDTILVSNLFDLQNFLPFFDITFKKYVQATNTITTIPFGELLVFLMIIPNVKLDHKKIKKYFFIGFLIGFISLLTVVFREIAVLGDTLSLFTYPSYETLKLINLGATFTRLEIILAFVIVMLSFSKVVFLFYVTVIAFAQILNLNSFKPFVLSIGIIITIYSLIIYDNGMKHAYASSNIHPVIWTFIEIILPVLTLILILVRKLNKRSAVK
jgi:spore germination protein KB